VLEERCLPSNAAADVPLPLVFEANQGQADPQAAFLARGGGYALLLTPQAAVLSLQQSAAADGPADELRLRLVGAADATPLGQDRLPGSTNYFIGNDPTRWRTGVPTYGRVLYRGVYPGIDLVYHGDQRQLEYDFDVAVGADPAQISLTVDGAGGTTLDAQGDLVLHTPGGDLVEHAPVLYQETAGGRLAVDGGYVLRDDGTVGFRVGTHDPTVPLVIDPVLSYASYFGGTGFDEGDAVAVGADGTVYVTGQTDSPDFLSLKPAEPLSGDRDAFVLKVNPDGTPAYLTYLGGSNHGGGRADDMGEGIAVDGDGNAYVTGHTGSLDFPTQAVPGQKVYQPMSSDARADDAFVTKLDPAGGLVYSTYLGGHATAGDDQGFDEGRGIAVDAAGNAYVAGFTTSPASTFPPLPGNGFAMAKAGGFDGFLAKLNAAGSDLLYFTYVSGGAFGDVEVHGVTVDASGDAYVTGATNVALPVTPGALQTQLAGTDAFLLKVNTNLSGDASRVYYTYLGGSGGDSGSAVAVDAQGDAYVVGSTNSPSFPAAASLHPLVGFQNSRVGQSDGFVAKVTADGSALAYFTYLGGTEQDFATAVAVDRAGNAYVTGGTISENYMPLVRPLPPPLPSPTNVFLTALTADGSAALFSTYIGNSGRGNGVAVDAAGNVWLTGTTGGQFPTVNPAQGSYGGGLSDAFLLRVTPEAGTVQFSAPAQTVGAGAGNVSLTLSRTGGSEGEITVHYATRDGSAVAGTDYVATAGDLTFADGETRKTITIRLLPGSTVAGNKSFAVDLSGSTGGVVGGAGTAAVTVIQPTPPAGSGPASTDLTGSVRFVTGRALYTPAVRRARVLVTVRNVGGTALAGPLWLVVDGLNRRVRLRRRSGPPPGLGGSPFVQLPVAGLNPGASVRVLLVFDQAPGPHVRFALRLVAGAPPL
jgi:hypothetical protein